jgi:hypothetical protein
VFVLFVLVTPLPVLPLTLLFEAVVIYVGFVPLLQPVPVSVIFPPIPTAILPALGIVDPMLPFFSLMPLMIVLRSRCCERPDRRH